MKLKSKIKENLKIYSIEEKIYLISVFFLYVTFSIYHILKYPIYIDEAITFNTFTSQGFFASVLHYPYPNNHVFFSVLTNITYYFPFDPLVNLRIPNFIIGIVTSILIYGYIRSIYDHKTTIIPHVFFTFSYFISFYSVFGRGYMFIIFSTLICFICIQKLQESFARRDLMMYVVVSALGFFTIPTFLYVSASFIVYLFILFYKDKDKLIILVKYHLLLFLIVLLLYTPILFNDGLDAIINNQWTKKISFDEIKRYYRTNIIGIYDKVLGVKSIYIFSLFIISLLIVYCNVNDKTKNKIYFVLLFMILPIIFIFIHHVIPGPRTWSYIIIPVTIGFAIILNVIMTKINIPTVVIYSLSLGLMFIQVIVFQKSHPRAGLEIDYTANTLSKKLFNRNYTSYYIDEKKESFQEISIQYHYISNRKTIMLFNKDSKSFNFQKQPVDCYIMNNNSSFNLNLFQQKYKLIDSNEVMHVYGR